jgi:excisionase family DNA binding protein
MPTLDQKNSETLLNFKEAMGFLRVSRSTIYRLMGSGRLTGYKVGSSWRFYRSDLSACLSLGETPTFVSQSTGAQVTD